MEIYSDIMLVPKLWATHFVPFLHRSFLWMKSANYLLDILKLCIVSF
uniref:Uncharacterized protein n=1 Tax=Arundo donax TaxID=35708 RepID=A0A0A9FSP6_ARUDO